VSDAGGNRLGILRKHDVKKDTENTEILTQTNGIATGGGDNEVSGLRWCESTATASVAGAVRLLPRSLTALTSFNLYAPCIIIYHIGQTYRYSPEYAFYIFSQKIYLIIFLDFLSPSSFIPPQNAVYFLMLPFLVHNIFTIYINGVLNCKCPAPGSKG